MAFNNPRLTKKERKALPIYWRDSPNWKPREEVVVDAQLRKALTWAYQEIMELATHFHELPHKDGVLRAGVETAAEELVERARLVGVEPWEE
ncbi:hypothetical protein LCGC14_0363720 [marine sediment metagenome]|uniref:Uncharacterized protein n=1 Tax=marine sediment metagenome TaxID=412755 RepID=A0A0F9WFH3_9ZZZZ